jgi:hypothetical protein
VTYTAISKFNKFIQVLVQLTSYLPLYILKINAYSRYTCLQALTPSQLSLLKRQIASLRSLNSRLKALANGVKAMPVVNLGSKRGRNVNPALNNKQGGGGKGKSRRRVSGSDSDDEKEASDSEEDEDADDNVSDDSEEAELSDSSLSGGKPVGKRASISTAPTRRTPRAIRQRPAGMLKEPSFDEDSDDNDSDGHSDGNTTTNVSGGTKSAPSPKKKRKLFVVVGGEPNGDGDQPCVQLPTLNPIKGAWTTGDDDALCNICGDGDGTDDNLILLCEGPGCDVAVHQMCYGVAKIPDGEWLCDTCAVKKKKKGAKYQCAICPVQGGALRRVTTFGKVVPAGEEGKKGRGKGKKDEDTWVHPACALWTPGVLVDDPMNMSKINVSGLTKARVGLKCTLCSQGGGATV